jgi:TatD DNase family protein
MGLFDVHAHLTHPELIGDIEGVIARAQAAGLSSIVSNGLNPADNAAVRELARRFPIVKPAFGLYPVDAVLSDMHAAGESYPGQREACPTAEAIAWVREHVEEAFAVGEIGLDGHWVKPQFWPAQDDAFRELVRLAMDANKAIIIHTRKRERDTLALLDELGARRVNWHCFTGRLSLAREIVKRGHYISIPANVRRSESFTRMLEALPRERLLLETDSPYLGPEKDVQNEPANVRHTAAFAAERWGTTEDAAAVQFAANFEALFGVAP